MNAMTPFCVDSVTLNLDAVSEQALQCLPRVSMQSGPLIDVNVLAPFDAAAVAQELGDWWLSKKEPFLKQTLSGEWVTVEDAIEKQEDGTAPFVGAAEVVTLGVVEDLLVDDSTGGGRRSAEGGPLIGADGGAEIPQGGLGLLSGESAGDEQGTEEVEGGHPPLPHKI